MSVMFYLTPYYTLMIAYSYLHAHMVIVDLSNLRLMWSMFLNSVLTKSDTTTMTADMRHLTVAIIIILFCLCITFLVT